MIKLRDAQPIVGTIAYNFEWDTNVWSLGEFPSRSIGLLKGGIECFSEDHTICQCDSGYCASPIWIR